MAEAIDVITEACGFAESNVAEDHLSKSREGSKTIERINLVLLAVGKFADLAADWILVWQVYSVLEAVSGCNDTCEHAGNWVCQDGVDLTAADAARRAREGGGSACGGGEVRRAGDARERAGGGGG